ncbi:MAG: YitT family protein [Lachnospiraceae bacterium]|nr:YitT family protein [Lachnospiraceae bacterium]
MKTKLRCFGKMSLGAIMYGAGVSLFLDPNSLAPGGTVGISIILNRFLGISTGTLYLLINIPILILGARKLGANFLGKTLYVVVVNTIVTDALAYIEPPTREPLLAAIAGSLLLGTGIGIVFQSGATTGGMDVIVKILRKKYKHIKTSSLFLALDLTVVTISGLVFRNFNTAMYALITVVLTGKFLDFILYGGDEAKLIFVVSDLSEKISASIIQGVPTGITLLKGRGAYSNKEKNVIMCVVRKQMAPKVMEIVKSEDENAFVIVSSATETFGQGYKNLFQEEL